MGLDMARDTLLDFFEDFSRLDDIFIVHDDGYRVRQATYRQTADAARRFRAELDRAGIGGGDHVVIWSENRAEWIVALWGILHCGAVAVPVDYRASVELLRRIASIVKARLVLVGEEVMVPERMSSTVWRLTDACGLSAGATSSPNPGTAPPRAAEVSSASLSEIIFTSGATAEPKGVTITHRNILANIVPIEREMAKYRRYVRLVHPIRFLNLLPLSHMFGQSMATFVPPMLAGTVVFSHGYSPVEIVRQIKTRRVSVLVCVPKVLDVLRGHVERAVPFVTEPDPLAGKHWAWRWWRYRAVHRMFGWKFWCVVCGAAPLDPELEAFWRKLGFLVVQGYGLTETAPIVTLNHPLRASRGTVGKPIAGVEVRIAPDGEILVRGDNVTSGYYKPEHTTGSPESRATETTRSGDERVFEDGWFHTGDIGELDEAGRLLIKGRKKEMIVTPQGLNVFPEDVERALIAQPGVTDAGVVGLRVSGEERIHAVLVVAPGADVDAILRGANAQLEDHQRVWSTSIWPGSALPRTEGTEKLRRRELQRWAAGERGGVETRAEGTSVADLVRRFSAGREMGPATTLEELGLSSLDRVELMMALEEAFQTTLDEGALSGARTLAEIEELVKENGARLVAPQRPVAGPELDTPPHSALGVDQVPLVEPLTALVASTANQPPHVDSAAVARVHEDAGRGPRASPGSPGAGDLCRQSPEPHGHAGDPRRTPCALAIPAGASHGEGVLQGALQPRELLAARVVHQQPQLLPLMPVLQCLPAPPARGGHPADAALHRGSDCRRVLGAHFS